mmetsp:Transcript_22380/g.27342  ORF Transcript_22380/g.27342 Transcript_22380/m.27342 type:complete len:365 (-) Transcript_22380:101-1195(-)
MASETVNDENDSLESDEVRKKHRKEKKKAKKAKKEKKKEKQKSDDASSASIAKEEGNTACDEMKSTITAVTKPTNEENCAGDVEDKESNTDLSSSKEKEGEIAEQNLDEIDASGAKPKRKRKRKKKKATADDDKDPEKADEGGNDYTVYIEGLPFDSTEEQIREFFERNGGITDIIEMRLPKWQDSGRLRGYGHVVFKSDDSKQKALSRDHVNGKNIGRRYINVQPVKDVVTGPISADGKAPVQPKGCSTIFVKNLPYSATETELQTTFAHFGKIVDGGIRLARNSENQNSKGFGYVEFKNAEGAYDAVQKGFKKGVTMSGRRLLVDYEENKPKGSFKTDSGKLWKKEFGERDHKRQRSTGPRL